MGVFWQGNTARTAGVKNKADKSFVFNLLAIMGLAVGVALPGPNLGSWNGVRDHLQVAGMVLWTLMILRFFLFFPKPKRFGTGPVATAVGGAVVGVALGAAWRQSKKLDAEEKEE